MALYSLIKFFKCIINLHNVYLNFLKDNKTNSSCGSLVIINSLNNI